MRTAFTALFFKLLFFCLAACTTLFLVPVLITHTAHIFF